jgi:hypothetical protein
MKNALRSVPGRGPGQVKFIPAQGLDRLCREELDQASSAEAPWRRRKKRRKLSGPPRSPAAAGTEDSPKGADVARGIVKWLVDVVDETGETVASRGLGSDDLDDHGSWSSRRHVSSRA